MVQLRFFVIPAYGDGQAEDELNRVLRSHRVLSVTRQLVSAEGSSFWAVCVEHLEAKVAEQETQARLPRIDYKLLLSDDEFARFSRLRQIRKELSEADNVPLYAIFSNEQLANMARVESLTSETMRAVDGVGDGKMARFGDRMLKRYAAMVPQSRNGS